MARTKGPAVQFATLEDVGSWLEIGRKVAPTFAPRPDFGLTLTRKIDQGNAPYGRAAAESPAMVSGRVLLGGVGTDPWIRRLAVRACVRGSGLGAALVGAALDRRGAVSTIWLDGFGADNTVGLPAHAVCLRFGCEPGEMVGPGPEGGTRPRLVRHAWVQPP